MGYWKTHTGSDEPARDPTYDVLNGDGFIFLGVLPDHGSPEEQVDDEAEAGAVFDAAGGPTVFGMKAQLLAAKLNDLKLPEFADAQFVDGATLSTGENIETFGQAMDAADEVLDDIANDISPENSDVEAIKDQLDAANNACPAVLGPEVATPTPAGLPEMGGAPPSTDSSPWVLLAVGAALAMAAGVRLTVMAKRRA